MTDVWVLEYFSIGSGTHMCDIWDGKPSPEQLKAAEPSLTEFNIIELLVDGTSESDHNLYSREIAKGEYQCQ